MPTDAMLIDCDGHILEPPDLWDTYLEPRYRDRAIRIRVGDDAFEYLEIDGKRAMLPRQGHDSVVEPPLEVALLLERTQCSAEGLDVLQ